jgi:NADPH:quinone reductase
VPDQRSLPARYLDAVERNGGDVAAIVANDAVIAAYATRNDPVQLLFWSMLFANVTIRLLGGDDFSAEAKQQAAQDLTAAAEVGDLRVNVGQQYPLEQIAQAHDRVEAGTRGQILVTIP